MPPPNILMIMTDQQRADALGCAGGWVKTPNFDWLAAHGVRFSACVSTSPVCIPARLSLATGLYPHNTGVWTNITHSIRPETPTWMGAIRQAGYRTAVIGKTHLHPHNGDLRERIPLMQAIGLDEVNEIGGPHASVRCGSNLTDDWERAGVWEAYRADMKTRTPGLVRPSPLPLSLYYDTWVGQQALAWLRGYQRPQPWFLWVSFGGPHEPWDCPEPYRSLHDPAAMPKPLPRPAWADDPARPRGATDARLAKPRNPTAAESAAMRADYAGELTLIDEQVGHLIAQLRERGELDNTVICLCSDHGEFNGDFGLIFKSSLLDPALRVPLIISTPATRARGQGAVNDGPVEWLDLGPTLAELAGAPLTHRQFGVSLVPVLNDPTVQARPDALAEIEGDLMLMTPTHKLVVNRAGQPYLLFDRQRDPGEQHNLVGEPAHQALCQMLRLRLLERVVSAQLG